MLFLLPWFYGGLPGPNRARRVLAAFGFHPRNGVELGANRVAASSKFEPSVMRPRPAHDVRRAHGARWPRHLVATLEQHQGRGMPRMPKRALRAVSSSVFTVLHFIQFGETTCFSSQA